jgi:radical SAM protein with 4Fe4S-binding SPASM domain
MDSSVLRLLSRHPAWARQQAREFFERWLLVKWQYWVGQAQCGAPPRLVSVRMNPPDSAEPCIVGQFGSFAVPPSKDAKKEAGRYLPLNRFRILLDEVAAIKARLRLWGSDPFSHPDIGSIIEYIREKRIYCEIRTRAVSLAKYAEVLADAEIDEIVVSIDGPATVYRNVDHKSDGYQRLEQGIRELTTAIRRKKARAPVVRGNVLIMAENYHYLGDVLTLAHEMGLDAITYTYTFSVTEQMGLSHHHAFLDTFNCPAQSWERYRIETAGIEISALLREVMRLRSKAKGMPVEFFPTLKPWQIGDFYKTAGFSCGLDRCRVPWFMMNVLEDGSVVSCVDYPDYTLGNLNDDAISSIWNNEEMRHFRTELIKLGKFPVCSKCSGLYLV